MRKILITITALFFSACGTVQPKYSDSFQESKNSAGVYTVKFTGNGNTTPEAVEQALDRRSAELTLREGYDYFTYYTKSRNDHRGMGQQAVPSFYGVIHMHRGLASEDGLDAKKIMAQPLPDGIEQ